MKNVKENQLKKCIFMEFEEYKNLILNVTDGLQSVEYKYYELVYIDTDKAEETDTFWNEDIEITLSKYFGVEVTSVHADDCEIVGIWIAYK